MWSTFVSIVSSLTTALQVSLHDRFVRMIKIEQTSVTKTGEVYSLPYDFGQVVRVNFVGQGAVLDGPHFAIVWDAHPKSDHIVVLPMTSKVRDPFYDLGQIDGLRKPNNIVKVNQPQTVSRKSVVPWYKKDANNNSIPVEISSYQKAKLMDLFRLSLLKEPNLQKVILEMIGDLVPLQVEMTYLKQLRRPVTFSIESGESIDKLWFRFHNETRMHMITLLKPGLGFGERKKLIRELLSTDDSIRFAAEVRLGQLLSSLESKHHADQAAPTKFE